MTITLSQPDYWELFETAESARKPSISDHFGDMLVSYPSALGQGYQRWISLRAGLELVVSEYELREDVQVLLPERPHPVEFLFEVATTSSNHHYRLWGSGLAPKEQWLSAAEGRLTSLNVHIEPELFQNWIGADIGNRPAALRPLLRSYHERYYEKLGQSTAAMQVVLQQVLNCPYQGFTRQLYLESKVWELMALLLEKVQAGEATHSATNHLRSEDVERIHYAGKILVRQLNDPPSLMELARAVGINDHKLKVGFRQVFGTTVFGYLHERRLERSQQLLATGQISVTEAAQVVGFASRGHFAAAFRRKFGVNPSVYLRQHA